MKKNSFLSGENVRPSSVTLSCIIIKMTELNSPGKESGSKSSERISLLPFYYEMASVLNIEKGRVSQRSLTM